MRVKWAKGEKKLKKIIIVNQISMEERGSLNKVMITVKKDILFILIICHTR